MNNKIISIILIGFVLFLAGCPKLVRRKKQEAQKPIYLFEDENKDIVDTFSAYKRNYIFWKTAHDELADNLDGEIKERQANFDYVIDYLTRLKDYFPKQEAREEEFEKYLNEYRFYENSIKSREFSSAKQELFRKKLIFIKKSFIKDFSPNQERIQKLFNEA